MATNHYALETNGKNRLDISWKGIIYNGDKITVSLDGNPVGVVRDKEAFLAGQEFRLPDGSTIKVQLVKKIGIQVHRNGQLLYDSVLQPQTLPKSAIQMKTCPKCSKENRVDSYYCISCGESLKYVKATSNKKTAKISDIRGPKDVFAGVAGGIGLILVGVWALVWVTPRYELINAPDSLIPIAGIFNIGLGIVWLWKIMTGEK
jgi:hypothetical protein